MANEAKPPLLTNAINTASTQVNSKLKFFDIIDPNNLIAWKGIIRVATTTNINLKQEQTIDGISLITNDTILVKNQTNAIENGIYIVKENNWIRSNFLLDKTPASGTYMCIREGNTNASTGWVCNNIKNESIVGTNTLNFIQINSSGGGGGGDPYNVLIKKQTDENIQWKININSNNQLQFFYSSNGGESFNEKYTFSPN